MLIQFCQCLGQASCKRRQRKLLTDYPGGIRQDLILSATSRIGQQATAGQTVFHALLAGARVGIAGIDHQVFGCPCGKTAFCHLHRRGAKTVQGENSADTGIFTQLQHHQVLAVGLLDASFNSGKTDTGDGQPFCLCHNQSFSVQRQASSHKPKQRKHRRCRCSGFPCSL